MVIDPGVALRGDRWFLSRSIITSGPPASITASPWPNYAGWAVVGAISLIILLLSADCRRTSAPDMATHRLLWAQAFTTVLIFNPARHLLDR